MKRASETFRKNVALNLLPQLKVFCPDLLLLSSGFDGHADDLYYGLTEDDIAYVTTATEALVPSGRVVSVLEGGYHIKPNKKLNNGKESNFELAATLNDRPIRENERSYGSLPRCVAAHVKALMDA